MKTKDDTTLHHHDPITGAPHSHPVATGIGAVGGAATGVAFGAPLGPVGSLIGGAIGAVAGGSLGHYMGDEFDPYEEEEKAWRERYHKEPYVEKGYDFNDYGPAYRFGHESYPKHSGKSYVDAERELSRQWDKVKGKSRLTWEQATHATKAGWHRREERKEERMARGQEPPTDVV